MPNQRVQRTSLVDQAALLLLERIRAGEWQLGERLPGETTLGPQLGVGRSTIREAIQQLAARGVLQSRQGAGVFVTALDARDDWETVLRQADIAAVIESRIAIEAEAAALAAARRSTADLRAIRRALAARVTTGQSIEEYVDADLHLHRSIVAAAHNGVLLELFDGFALRVREAMVTMLAMRPDGTPCDADPSSGDQEAHAALVRAIAERSAERAMRLAREHLTSLQEALA